MSWLHDHQEQLDGYQLYTEIAYRFRPKVLPDDRDDIEVEITLKLKAEADKKDHVTMGFLYTVARVLWELIGAKSTGSGGGFVASTRETKAR